MKLTNVDLVSELTIQVNEELINDVIESCNHHIKKYGFRKMTTKEFDGLCGVN